MSIDLGIDCPVDVGVDPYQHPPAPFQHVRAGAAAVTVLA